jgi:hypothetical protein
VAVSIQRITDAADGATTETDMDGGFRFERLLPGQMLVRTRGASTFQSAMVTIADGQTARVDFRSGVALTGLLLSAGGDPIPGAVIMASSIPGSMVRRGRTDGRGRFRIEGLESGAWTLDAQVLGDLNASVVAEAGYTGYSARVGRIEMASVDQDVTLRLESGEIHGMVFVAATGEAKAFPDVTLQLQTVAGGKDSVAGGRVVGVAFAGKDGAFRFLGLGAGRYQLLANATDNALRAFAQVVDLTAGERKEVAIALESCRSGTVRFAVRDPDGRPIEGVSFALVDGATIAVAGAEPGVYRATMEVGTWLVLVSKPGMQVRRVSVGVGESELPPVEVALKWGGEDVSSHSAAGEVAGRVLAANGNDIPQGVTISLSIAALQLRLAGGWAPGKQAASLRPAEHGRFRFRELAPGRYRLTAIPTPRTFRMREVDVTLGAGHNIEDVDIRLEECEGGHVRLVVKDEDGRPVEGAKFATVAGGTMTTLIAANPDTGVYEATLERGTHRVSVSASGYQSSRVEIVVKGDDAGEVAVILRAGSR